MEANRSVANDRVAVAAVRARMLFILSLALTFAGGLSAPVLPAQATASLVQWDVGSSGPTPTGGSTPTTPNPLQPAPSIYVEPTPPPDPASDSVGATPGTFRVDESGSSTYVMPIYVPPATAGMSPMLSFNYQQRGGNGAMGPGFAIGGSSSIARCRKSTESGDGAGPFPGINFDSVASNDAYCLDGMRLWPRSLGAGSCPSTAGATAVEYGVETDPSLRVCGYDKAGVVGAAFWLVQPKDGSYRRYGVAGNSALQRNDGNGNADATKFLSWNLDRIADASGNVVEFTYAQDNTQGEINLSEVGYTGKISISTLLNATPTYTRAPYNKVQFSYTTMPASGQRVDYVSGMKLALTQQLSTVTVLGTSNHGATPDALETVRIYYPEYTTPTASGQWALAALRECAPNGASEVCYPRTRFTWNNNLGAIKGFPYVPVSTTYNAGLQFAVDYKVSDINADGRQDLIWIKDRDCEGGGTFPQTRFQLMTSLSTGTGYAAPVATNLYLNRPPVPPATGLPNCGGDLRPLHFETLWHLYDFSGDGRDDILLSNGSAWYVFPAVHIGSDWTYSGATSTPTGITATPTDDGRLLDLDADGLPDFLHGSGSGSINARFLRRAASTTVAYAFTSTDTIVDLESPASPPGYFVLGLTFSTTPRGNPPAGDLDGDGAADLLVKATFQGDESDPQCPLLGTRPSRAEAGRYLSSLNPEDLTAAEALVCERRWYTYRNAGIQPNGHLLFAVDSDLGLIGAGGLSGRGGDLQLADINGDGQADVMYQAGGGFSIRMNAGKADNTGAGERLLAAQSTGLSLPTDLASRVQLLDVSGDHKLDLFYAIDLGSGSQRYPLKARLFGSTGFGSEIGVGNATSDAQNPLTTPSFVIDASGDGVSDLVRFSGNAIRIAEGALPLGGNDFVTYIVNGLGAVDTIGYMPLPYSSVYTREFDGPSKVWGRGAPVFDVFSSMWVVNVAYQTAPTASSGTDVSGVRYRYSGARLQAGGRGFLGFKTMQTEDLQNQLVTTTEYRQDFPYVGRPSHTVVEKIDAPIPDPCLSNPHASGCFREPPESCGPTGCPIAPSNTAPNIGVGGRLISDSSTTWTSTPTFNPATWQSIFPYSSNTDEQKFDLETTGVLSHQLGSTFTFDSLGNLLNSTVTSAHADSGGSPVTDEIKITTNVYGCTIAPPTVSGCTGASLNAERRRLGRLSIATVDSSRPGATNVKRRASFEYDPVTLLLTAEIQGPYDDLEPVAESRKRLGLRTDYALDANGNKVGQYTCSTFHYATRAACISLSGFQQQQWEADTTRIQRYAKWVYEPKGRFLLYSLAPFYSASATNHTDENVGEYIGIALAPDTPFVMPASPNFQIVTNRNAFGDPFNKIAATGMGVTMSYGLLGRAQFESRSTGQFSLSTYTWCQDVVNADIPGGAPRANCPTGAMFRTTVSSVASTGVETGSAVAPTHYAYFDRLGREMLTTTRIYQQDSASLNRWSSVGTTYDSTGRGKTVTVAYFSIDPGTTQAATNRAGKPLGSTPAIAESSYDAIGRARLVDHPEQAGNGASSTVMTYDKLTTDVINPRAFQSTQAKNARGEMVSATDPAGLTVSYDRDAVGNLTGVRRTPNNGDSAGTQISTALSYDRLGRKISITDPDKGTWQTKYNALGEVVEQTDAKGQTQSIFRDALGRVFKRTETRMTASGLVSEPTSTWEFDTATRTSDGTTIKGVPRTESNGLGGFGREMHYDAQGRLESVVSTLEGMAYTERQTYDSFGRTFQHVAPSTNTASTAGEQVEYSADGYPIATSDTGTGQRYNDVLALTARGQVRQERFHNTTALTTTRTYDDNTGRLLVIDTGASAIQRWETSYDKHTDVTSRWNRTTGYDLKEDFTYDALDRLGSVTLTRFNGGAVNQGHTLTYDQLGNLKSRVASGGTTTWTYGAAGTSGCTQNAGPHAVSEYNGNRYCYDANGNQTLARYPGGNTRTIIYTGYDLPESIVTTGTPSIATVGFKYGPDRGMWKRTDGASGGDRIFCSGFQSAACAGGGGSSASTTFFVGNVEIRQEGTSTTTKRYVGGYLVVTTTNTNATPQYAYLFRDALGSLDVITNQAGVVQQRLSFDAWGKRRVADPPGGNIWSLIPAAQAASFDTSATRQGYTGHEQLDSVGLVHMKGRLYDPELGRFIQADSFTEADATQGLNRYSYVLNNPLSLTDPSGHQSLSWRQVAAIVIAVVAAYFGNYYFAENAWASFAVTVVGGFASAYVATGSLRAGLWGAFAAGVFWGIGSGFSSMQGAEGTGFAGTGYTSGQFAAKVAAHGAAGGVLSELQGGSFGSGFLAAGATQAVSPAIESLPAPAQFVASAAVGGTVSEATGGSFGNGAATAAFQFLFNNVVHSMARSMAASSAGAASPQKVQLLTNADDKAIPQGGFSTYDDAVKYVGHEVYVASNKSPGKWEYGGAVIESGGGFFPTTVATSGHPGNFAFEYDIKQGQRVAGLVHMHPAGGTGGLPGVIDKYDVRVADQMAKGRYVWNANTPNGFSTFIVQPETGNMLGYTPGVTPTVIHGRNSTISQEGSAVPFEFCRGCAK